MQRRMEWFGKRRATSIAAPMLGWVVWLFGTGSGLPAADVAPPASKKGLQVEMIDDALALGIKHATFNLNISQLVAPDADPDGHDVVTWRHEGNTFCFNKRYVSRMDRDISKLAQHDVVVYLIVLAYQSPDDRINRRMLHPGYDRAAPNRLGAFNTATEEGRQWLEATFQFMAHRWSANATGVGPVVGYILGNEVNSHWWWSNMGRVTMEEFADQYLLAARIAHQAVRRHAPAARIYLSLEHHWNIRFPAGDAHQAFPGKQFIDYFARAARESPQGDFDWHLAFHPYPEDLFDPRFWNDTTALPQEDTPRITFKNLEVLTAYFRRPELLHAGEPRRIILSEQGFHTPDGAEGEAVQAAAFCYAYRKVAALDGIDAFILHRHVDHPHEGGLRLGLRRYMPDQPDPRPKKRIYECFRLADTPQWEAAFEFALPIIGLDHW